MGAGPSLSRAPPRPWPPTDATACEFLTTCSHLPVRLALVNQLFHTACCLALLVGCSTDAQTATSDTPATSSTSTGTTTSTTTATTESTSTISSVTCDSRVTRDIPYDSRDGVEPELLSLDVYPVLGQCDAPVAIWIHGGGWSIGDKGNLAQQRAEFYNSRGWLLVAINYRLTTADANPPVSFPDHNNDAAAALRWVDQNIAQHGGDPSTVMLAGHSAGAGIAASLVADPSYLAAHDLAPAWLTCTVLLDTAGYDVAAAAQGAGAEIYVAAFGSDPAGWVAASPITHVGEGPLPARALIVTRGQPARQAEAQAFTDALIAAGVDAELVDANPLTHAEVNNQIGVDGTEMTALMTTELTRCET